MRINHQIIAHGAAAFAQAAASFIFSGGAGYEYVIGNYDEASLCALGALVFAVLSWHLIDETTALVGQRKQQLRLSRFRGE